MFTKLKTNKVSYIIVFLILLLIYWRWLLPFPHVANDLHVAFGQDLTEQMGFPYTWGTRGAVGMGEYAVSILWSWPVHLIFGILGTIGFSHNLLNQISVIALITIGALGIKILHDHYKIRKWGIFAGIIFYLASTYILLIIDGGQLLIGLAYAWMPIAYLMVDKSINSNLKQKIVAGLSVAILGFFDIRFVYVLLLLLLLRFIYEFLFLQRSKWITWTLAWTKSGAVVGLIMIGLNAYWIIPAVLARTPALPVTYQQASQVTFLSFANLGHAIYLLQPHWFGNVFGKITNLKASFILIPILVFLAPLLKRKNKVVGFWLLVALVGVFLVKGVNPPFPGIYPWFFSNIPGFSLFRDPTKFFFLVALSYSVLIGITTNELVKRFKWKITLIPLILASYFIILARPAWLGQMTGTFAAPVYQDDYFVLAERLKKDLEFDRVFWIPTKTSLGFSSPTHSSVEASRLLQKRPFAIGTVGTYEIFNFLREAPFMGELFNIAGIKYIVYPFPDIRREELKQDNIEYYYAFLDQLSNLPWIDSKISDPPVAVLKTKKSQDHFSVAKNTWFVTGSDRFYWDLIDIEGFDLSNNALIFAEEQPGLGKEISDFADVILYEKKPIDLVATFVEKSKFIFPAEQLDFSPSPTDGWPASNALRSNAGWWKRESPDLISWRAFLQEKYGIDNLDFDYGGGWAVAEGNTKYKIHDSRFKNGNILLARVMSSSKGGKLEFYQADERIGEIETNVVDAENVEIKLSGYEDIEDKTFVYDKADFGWYEVGKLTHTDIPLTIKTQGDINVVNALVSIDSDKWLKLNDNIQKLDILDWNKLTSQEKTSLFINKENEIELSFRSISPTRYKLEIKGVNEPVTLAFSETYDPMWELHGRKALPLYSLINGFTILEDGEYQLYFTAQQYVIPGLYLSGLTLVIVFLLLIRSRKKS